VNAGHELTNFPFRKFFHKTRYRARKISPTGYFSLVQIHGIRQFPVREINSAIDVPVLRVPTPAQAVAGLEDAGVGVVLKEFI
jgi:hypothetical protein